MWRVEYSPAERLLTLSMRETVYGRDMRDLAEAYSRALEATGGEPFSVFLDLRGLHPLESEAVKLLTDMKRITARMDGYRGGAALANSPTIAMQQRNATAAMGSATKELITLEENAAQEFLAKLG